MWKGKKMAGQMGGDQVTVRRLRVVQVDTRLNLVYVKGAVPGPKEAAVKIRDSIYGPVQFDPYASAPHFPTVTGEQLAQLDSELRWSGESDDPLVRRYNL